MEDKQFKQLLQNVEKRLDMQEFEFPCSIPIIGGIVSGVRKLWNSVAARWYVRYYHQQQMSYNVAVMETLQHLCHHYENTVVQLENHLREYRTFQEEALQRDQEALQRDQEASQNIQKISDDLKYLSSNLRSTHQYMLFTQELLEKDVQLIAKMNLHQS